MSLTPRCIRAIDYAKAASLRLNSPHLTGSHLVLGLLSLGGGVATNVLQTAGLSLESIEAHIKSKPFQNEEATDQGDILVGESAAIALTRAAEEARLCSQTYVGTEHLLLALLAQNHGPTADLFRTANVDRRTAAFTILHEYGFNTPPILNKLLLLEDNLDRIASFRSVVQEWGPNWALEVWHDAPKMLEQCEGHFDSVRLISLDHDLNPQPGVRTDPGTGREIARFLAGHEPLAPVIIHSSNADAAWSMHNDLRFAGWSVERVGPIGEDWVRALWLPRARALVNSTDGHMLFRRPSNHNARTALALCSLEGLAIGDALGEMLSYQHRDTERILAQRLPPRPWRRTDDSEMAISIFEILRLYGYIHQDALSRRFAARFERDPDRGYGKMTRLQMDEIIKGGDWRKVAAGAFSGQGSMGNGAAMRVAPVGAYFWDHTDSVIQEASRSASVTHTHPEGIAGAIAVALAAAEAVRIAKRGSRDPVKQIFEAAHADTPKGKVRDGIKIAAEISADINIHQVAKILGNGSLVTAQDTVPYALWCAAHHLNDFVKSLTVTISGGGDCDTTAAIVGGIVTAFCGVDNIPNEWRNSKEPFPFS